MIFSSMSSRLLYHLGENLVPVREAGDHVYVFTAVRLQLRRRGGDVRLDGDLFPGNAREGEPLRQIVANAGDEPSVVVNTVAQGEGNFGYNAQTGEYGDLVEMGVLDPTKVTRTALQNAASVASLILTTDCMVADIPQDDKPMPAGMEGMGGMPGMM